MAAFRKLGREVQAIKVKDETGYYARTSRAGIVDPQQEHKKLWGHSYDPKTGELGKLTIELIIIEDWTNRVACAIWMFPNSVGPIIEFRLTSELPKSVRTALGVRTGARGALARLEPLHEHEEPTSVLAYLSSKLFPSELNLQNVERILIRPGGLTAELPYSALRTVNGYVGSTLAVVVIPSGTDLNQSSLPRTGRYKDSREVRRFPDTFYVNPLVVGNPITSWDHEITWERIDATESEARKVAEIFQTKAIVGSDARKEVVLSRMRSADYIHLASHAVSDVVNPMTESFVVLSGSYLTGRDIQRAPPLEGRPVVVLSACQTGLGKPFEGGAYGLARAFITKGAVSVVGNLWNVDDAVSGEIMTNFSARIADGEAPEYALRDILRDAAAASPDAPAYWASFVIYGIPTEGHRATLLPPGLWPWAY